MSNSLTHFGMRAGALMSLSGAVLLSGCAAPALAFPAAPEQRTEIPPTAQEHQTIASGYERLAAADAAAAKRHASFAEVYRRNRSSTGEVEAHEPLAKHCDGVAQTYRQASEQKLSMAKLHRELARQAKQD